MSLFNEIKSRLVAFVFLPVINLWAQFISNKPGDVWLIGENQGEALQDNGYAFYKFCRRLYPEMPVYFALKLESPLYTKELSGDPNVLAYGSISHIKIFSAATHFFYSHTYRDLMYRRFFEIFGRGRVMVHLHHGSLGFKKFDEFLYRNRNIMDVYTVGSELERSILVHQADVDDHRIKVTGYARNDYLLEEPSVLQRQIVYIPTHRRHLGRDTRVEFLDKIEKLLYRSDLIRLLEKNDFSLKIFLHAHTQKTLNFENSFHQRIQVLRYGETSVRKLLRDSMLMITDYSSVCWDFLTLGKPVLFYRFDVGSYSKLRGSYIDLSDESYGEIAHDEAKLLQLLARYINNDCKLKAGVADSIGAVLPSDGISNCDRIFKLVHDLQKRSANVI